MSCPGPDHDDAERKGIAPWFRLDASFYGDDRIIEIGEAHGPAGPAVFVALMGAAKAQNEHGAVKFGWRSLARTCFLPDVDTAQQVIGACEDAGLILVKAVTERGFTAEIIKWDLYQRPAPLTNAERAARHRDRKRVTDVTNVTPERDERDEPSRESRPRTATVDRGQKTTAVPQQQQVAPAVADQDGLHPSFGDVMALAQEAAGKDSKLLVVDMAVDTMLRAYPHADHVQAARLAVADILAGSIRQPYFHKVLGWKLKDQPAPAPDAPVDADPHGLLARSARELAQHPGHEGDTF